MGQTLTAHTIVKNEENFVEYAIRSVINYVDKIIIYDTGSTDRTVEILENLKREFPEKIIFEEKGECDKKHHTELRQEMLDRTNTDWFMILDGDEVWTNRGMEEALRMINENNNIECLIVPFYLCVGDVFHRHFKKGSFQILGNIDFITPRFLRKGNVKWTGDYGRDTFVDINNNVFFKDENCILLNNRFWHLTHLKRSNKQDDFSSGGKREGKVISTYFIIGRKIKENLPEVFKDNAENLKLSLIKSFLNFWIWITKKLTKTIGNLS